MTETLATEPNGLPMDAVVRTIEIEPLYALGQSLLPEPLLLAPLSPAVT